MQYGRVSCIPYSTDNKLCDARPRVHGSVKKFPQQLSSHSHKESVSLNPLNRAVSSHVRDANQRQHVLNLRCRVFATIQHPAARCAHVARRCWPFPPPPSLASSTALCTPPLTRVPRGRRENTRARATHAQSVGISPRRRDASRRWVGGTWGTSLASWACSPRSSTCGRTARRHGSAWGGT